jgi:general stress protein 26
MLKGAMEVLTDAESKQMIWKKGDTIRTCTIILL